ncbi:TetR/AcrR family transcriptional regulator [Paenibacillus dokdonensis]|uniref:TetR/AcrR family transcriptional regulator n=1 Tax=Paenibacillus dokdonensis TaxID=2567944 RepID=A0ABU6GR11_9BACL|nr:TetR/AcrR family transcriptional regulator [Paenibacillus dokdonensis]MEC0242148.1 TetR/AcrR family transcriptional regulator [Paenibacillus dokdonensis]
MKKSKDDAELTKQAIVDAAKELFAAKGYAATSMADICSAAGCSRGGLYHHFESKEDLFVYLADQSFAVSWENWGKVAENSMTATEQLYMYADYFVDTLQKPLNKAGEEFLSRVGPESEAGQRFIGVLQVYMQRFESLVQAGLDRGEWKGDNPQELAMMILGYFSGLSDSIQLMDKADAKQFYRKATMLLLEGIQK